MPEKIKVANPVVELDERWISYPVSTVLISFQDRLICVAEGAVAAKEVGALGVVGGFCVCALTGPTNIDALLALIALIL